MTAATAPRPGRPRTATDPARAVDVHPETHPAAAPASAPTEAEIRAMIAEAGKRGTETQAFALPGEPALRAELREVARWYVWPLLEDAQPIGEDDRDPVAYMWADLRRAEARRLMELIDAAADRAADRCVAVIADELTAAVLAFSAEYPNAPRARAESSPS